jgi:hypothetical protein
MPSATDCMTQLSVDGKITVSGLAALLEVPARATVWYHERMLHRLDQETQ